ncbi:MAG: hypothetical protein IT179_18520 [Acidobacteria bacterium]|nr:hypothetical protein [Acidobacteriota bacterium]
MELKRRFIFNGSAAAYGGRFVRPDDVVLASSGGSALSVAGGRSEWKARDIRLGKSFRVARAETSATGLADDLGAAIRVTHGKLPAEALTATTTVSARVRGVEVGGAPPLERGEAREPLMKVADVSASMTSKSAEPGAESSVVVDNASISVVTFDGHRLRVDVDIEPFKRYDTRAKLLAAKNVIRQHGDQDRIFSTIVRGLAWLGKPFPGAEFINSNGVAVPNLGRFYFGEILIKASQRRLTMIRMEMGSPTGGVGVFIDVDTNGTWSE